MQTEDKRMRSELLERCEKLARSDSIFEQLVEVVKQDGYVGVPRIPCLVWLATITGKEGGPPPVSLVVKGCSGGGKSFNLNAGLRLVPKNAYVSMSGMSDKALVYMKDINLSHKHLVIGEAAGASAEGRVFLRQLLTEGEIRYATVLKDKSGQFNTRELYIPGPTGLLMTTTAYRLYHEDETRMLSFNVPDSADQIRASLMAMTGDPQTLKGQKRDVTEWYALHEYITSGPRGVSVPFAPRLVDYLPVSHDRIKRDFRQIISLIKACALVHQFTRDIDENGRLVAAKQDYALIHDLLDELLSENLAVSVQSSVRAVVEGVAQLDKQDAHDRYAGVTFAVVGFTE